MRTREITQCMHARTQYFRGKDVVEIPLFPNKEVVRQCTHTRNIFVVRMLLKFHCFQIRKLCLPRLQPHPQ